MRTGPGRNYPATWTYVRADLPIRVVEVYQNWRKIEDPDGTRGWMLVSLLSDTRTAIVRGEEPRAMHEQPDEASTIRFRAAPGVVGRVSRCAAGWCRFDVRGRTAISAPIRSGASGPTKSSTKAAMADLLLADFAQRVGDSFEIVAGELAVVLTLGDARAIPGSARAGGGFRLEFSGPPDPVAAAGHLSIFGRFGDA